MWASEAKPASKPLSQARRVHPPSRQTPVAKGRYPVTKTVIYFCWPPSPMPTSRSTCHLKARGI
ncbi:hypothetical protein E2C01_004188 [Portunus trituberculatus]|uniref:Uncharacterized protein n=1 Tax=Portunus trituberculatus TaxID=210409 RepID=A0A5B7CRR0_PORTR|nr:hypothetical protein [Portunus trituberculatus]